MTTYRTGNHWGVTIVAEGNGHVGDDGARRVDDQLVAVVVNGDQALAERICELLNTEPTEHEMTTLGEPHRTFLRPDGTRRVEPYGEDCDCGHEGLDEMFHLTPCPIAMRRLAKRRALREEVEDA